MRLQSFPRRIHIARPEERRIALHACAAVAMQSVRPLVGPVELRAFPMHAIADETGLEIERIAFVGPPAVHAESERLAMLVPVAARAFRVETRKVTRVVHSSAKFVGQ